MGNFIPVEPEKWAEMVKAAAVSDYWRIEAETDHARWLRTLEENEKLRAEVERLRKAGDDLVRHIDWRNVVITVPTPFSFFKVHPECLCNRHNFDEVIKAWNAANEGKDL